MCCLDTEVFLKTTSFAYVIHKQLYISILISAHVNFKMLLSTLTGFFFQSFYQILAENHGTEHVQFLLFSKANITIFFIFFHDRVTTLIGVNEFQNELNLFCQPSLSTSQLILFQYMNTVLFTVTPHNCRREASFSYRNPCVTSHWFYIQKHTIQLL